MDAATITPGLQQERHSGVHMQRLVSLVRTLKEVSGHDIGVTLAEARKMPPDALAEKIREFGRWHKTHCENVSQTVEDAIFRGLDDEANAPSSPTAGKRQLDEGGGAK